MNLGSTLFSEFSEERGVFLENSAGGYTRFFTIDILDFRFINVFRTTQKFRH